MKLGIIIKPEAEQFHKAKALGLDFVEMDLNSPDYWGCPMAELMEKLPELKEAQKLSGMEVGAVGRWASKILDEKGGIIEAEWKEVKSVIDFGAQLGAKHYLCSVAYVKELSYYKNISAAIEVLKKIVAYAKEKGMECSIVNCIMGDNYIRTPEQWKLVLDEVPGLKIKYDPSHSYVHGGKNGAYIEEGLAFGDKFGYVHIKGVVQGDAFSEVKNWRNMDLMKKFPQLGEELGAEFHENHRYYDNPPAGIDVTNWRAFFAILYKYGYDGYLAIEPHSATWQGEKGDKGVQYTIKYIRDLML